MSENNLKILSLEDNPYDAELQKSLLERSHLFFEWVNVATEQAFKNALKDFQPDIVLVDYALPGYSGEAALNYMREAFSHIPVIVVTGAVGEVKAVELIHMGAVDFILKDRLATLPNSILKAVQMRALAIEREENLVRLQKSQDDLHASLLDFIKVLASMVELRDPYTAGHQSKVAQLSSAIAERMGLGKSQMEGVYLAGLVHDIGKIRVPSEILTKPGKLNKIEYALVQQHVEDGYNVLKQIHCNWPIADVVRQHHERLNGSGYPLKLKEKDILIEARILAVADVVDAITSHRPYRPGLGLEYALDEINKGKGLLYDVNVVEACLSLFKEKGIEFHA